MYCTECGQETRADAKFCRNCGEQILPETPKASDLIHPKLGALSVNTRNADLGWEWCVSSYFFARSGWRPVMFDRYDFARYRRDIEGVIAVLDHISDQQSGIIDLITSKLKRAKHDMSKWSTALARIDEVRIYHDRSKDIACIYFGETVENKGYRHVRATMSFSSEIIDVSIASV